MGACSKAAEQHRPQWREKCRQVQKSKIPAQALTCGKPLAPRNIHRLPRDDTDAISISSSDSKTTAPSASKASSSSTDNASQVLSSGIAPSAGEASSSSTANSSQVLSSVGRLLQENWDLRCRLMYLENQIN